MKARTIVTAAIPAVLLAAGTARAEGLAGLISISIQGGTQSELSGELVRRSQGTLLSRPANVNAHRYKDVYQPALRLQGSIGYGLAERFELVVRGGYYEVEGSGVEAGTLNGKALFAYFGQLEDAPQHLIVRPVKEVGAELALRYYFAPQSRLKSFIAPVVGLRQTSAVQVSFTSPDIGARMMNVPWSEKSRVPVLGLDIGFGFDLTENLYVGLDSGLRYQGAPAAEHYLSGLDGIDDSSGRWTAPVVAMIGLRF
jgi:hypothetical protein